MKKTLILTLFLVFANSLFALPPKVKLDQYMKGLAKAIKAENYPQAETYFSKLDTLVKEHKLKLPSSYTYFKAKTYLKNKKYNEAYTYAEKYLDKTGAKGKYYNLSLEVLDEAELKLDGLPYVVIDGVMWQDVGKYPKLSWREAKAYCERLELAGYSDWYLPSKKQLLGLYEKRSKLKFENKYFFWSYSSNVSYSEDAWFVYFKNGYSGNYRKTHERYVRCARAGQ